MDGFTDEELRWIEADQALRRRAREIAEKHGRGPDDIYRTLKNFQRTPAERLALGLRHAQLHPDRRRVNPSR